MQKLLAATAVTLLSLLSFGCAPAARPLVSAEGDAPPAPVFTVHAERAHVEPAGFVERGTTFEIASIPPTPARRACTDASSAAGFYGLYRTDDWGTKTVSLTFDDGPHPKLTPGVLDTLARHEQHATFFLIGRNINRETFPLVQRMVREGHALASHSYTHNVAMTRVSAPDASFEEIRAQHAVTAMLIDLALVATSGDDFDRMFVSVFEADPAVWLTGTKLRASWRAYAERHAALLTTLGFEAGRRPYDVLYSRPPGGGPYVEHDGAQGIAIYDRAMKELGMVNVLWNAASGDTVPEKRKDFAFLTSNMEKGVKAGGVLLIHDYMRPDALEHSLAKIAADDDVDVVPLGHGVADKYGCEETDLLGLLRAD